MKVADRAHPFDRLVQLGSKEFRLAQAALLLAAEEYPYLDQSFYLRQIDDLADEFRSMDIRGEADRIDALIEVLVHRHGFRGNVEDFENPENSYLNRVLRTRRGIPISISTIWIDVASRLNWPVYGVNMPGHFLVCYEGLEDRIWLDPFNGGLRLTMSDCIRRVRRICGEDRDITVDDLAPVNDRVILQRMLGNLLSLYGRSEDWDRAIGVLYRLHALLPESADVCRQLAWVHMENGELGNAMTQLGSACVLDGNDEEKAATACLICRLESLLAIRN